VPIIEFKCPVHGKFELILFGESAKMKNTVCQKPKCTRVAERVEFSTFAPRFKGTGFYNTTYQRNEKMDKIVEEHG
jgi:predicted nucleic acid-binding Zn ribbon protein